MKNYQNIFIVGTMDYVLAVNYAGITSQVRCLEFKEHVLPINREHSKAAELNALSILNKYLKNIVQLATLTKTDNIMCYITIPDKLYNYIQKGTYKNWLKNGVTMSGNPISEAELKLWKEFTNLYIKSFEHVNFKSLMDFTNNKPKFDYKNYTFARTVINSCEERIEAYKNEKLEKILVKNA